MSARRPAAAPAASRRAAGAAGSRGRAATGAGRPGPAGPTRRTPCRPPAMARPPATARRARYAGLPDRPARTRPRTDRARPPPALPRGPSRRCPAGRSWWHPVAALPGWHPRAGPSRRTPASEVPIQRARRAGPTAPALPPAGSRPAPRRPPTAADHRRRSRPSAV